MAGYSLTLMSKFENFLYDDNVTDIYLNQDTYIWVKTRDNKYRTDITLSSTESKSIMNAIASENMKELGEGKKNIVQGILTTGDRFHGVTGSESGNITTFAIRKKARKIYSLDEYIEMGIMTREEKDYIVEQVKNQKNMLIVGGTGSGKTTLMNAIINELKDTNLRLLIIEDTDEIQSSVPDTVKLTSTDITSSNDLMECILRYDPDLAAVGEMRRGDEVYTYLEALNSGHDGGMSTVHSSNSRGGILRLQQLLMNYKQILPHYSAPFIENSVDILISIQKNRFTYKRKITEIAELKKYDYDKATFVLDYIFKKERA
jgi:P-type conjugative transfer ATPase trbB